MIVLLIAATIAAPIIAIVFAEWWRVRRRAKSKAPAADTRQRPGWVDDTIKGFRKEKGGD